MFCQCFCLVFQHEYLNILKSRRIILEKQNDNKSVSIFVPENKTETDKTCFIVCVQRLFSRSGVCFPKPTKVASSVVPNRVQWK